MKASSSISSLVSPVLASQGRLLPGFRALGISGFRVFFFFLWALFELQIQLEFLTRMSRLGFRVHGLQGRCFLFFLGLQGLGCRVQGLGLLPVASGIPRIKKLM